MKKQLPPKIFWRFFRWYCHPMLIDHIEGDLLEEYQERFRSSGKLRADLLFIFEVIFLCRPGIIRPPQRTQHINSFAMYKSYFTIGWRNLLRNRGYSLINIGGLTIGMAVAMLNGLWIWDEVSFDKYHENYDHIAQFAETGDRDGSPYLSTSMTFPLGIDLVENYQKDFKRIARTSWESSPIISHENTKFTTNGLYVEQDMPEMLTLEMLQGSRSALSKTQTIILSASLAKSLFGYDDPLGKTVRINNSIDATVNGVYKDLPANTRFAFVKFFGSWDMWIKEQSWIEQRALTDLRNHFIRIFVELHHDNDFTEMQSRIAPLLKFDPRDAEDAKKHGSRLALFPMRDWHLHGYSGGQPDTTPMMMIKLVGAIGIFILLLACINFMNLSTARSEKRAKEVGIRKAIGSVRSQLINQFFSESFMVVFFSFLTAVLTAWLCLPWFNNLAAKQIEIPWSGIYFWLVSFAFCIVTSVLAGSYPALYLSSFNPVTTLKGKIRYGKFAALPRKILVVMQFSISVVLIICTAVIYQQIEFAKDRPVGFNRSGLLMIEKRSADFYGKYDVLQTELKNTNVVEEISESQGAPTQIVSGNNGWDWKGRDPNLDESFVTHTVSHSHGRTIGWEFVQGSDFSVDNINDSSGVVINEAALKLMGLKDPIGEPVSWKWWQDGRVLNYKILGVIKNPVMDSPYASAFPTIFFVKGFNGSPDWINIRIKPTVSISEALPKIERVFKNVIPSAPFDYLFADEEHALKFAAEERVGKLASVFAALAIFISCLGLFGLASFVAEQRTKEIGIRKVLGATVAGVWRMLSKDFVVLVLISCALSVPLAWYMMSDWLQHYNYRIELSVWTFVLTCFAAVLITLSTVSFQAVKAGITNPVNSLRAE